MQTLLEYGADVNAYDFIGFTALMYASVKGHIEIVRMLLQYTVDVDALNNYNGTALMLASINGHIEIIQLLIQHGANPNINNNKAIQRAKNDNIRKILTDYQNNII